MSNIDQTLFLSKPLFGSAPVSRRLIGARSAVLSTQPSSLSVAYQFSDTTCTEAYRSKSDVPEATSFDRQPLSKRVHIKWSDRGKETSQIDAMTPPLPFCLHLADS